MISTPSISGAIDLSPQPTDGQVPVYDASTQLWVPTARVTSVAGRTGAVMLAESDVAGLVADLASKLSTAGGTMTGDVNLGGHSLTNVGSVALTSEGTISASVYVYISSPLVQITGNLTTGGTINGITLGTAAGHASTDFLAAGTTTSGIAEGTNLYYTDARASAAAPVQSVAGRTGAVTLAAADVSGVATTGANTFTAGQTITLTSTSDVGLKVTLASGATGDAVEINSFGTTGGNLLKVDKSGNAAISGTTLAIGAGSGAVISDGTSQILRMVNASGAWTDSQSASFFQFGRAYGVFSGASGVELTRFAVTAVNTTVSDCQYGLIPVSTATLNVFTSNAASSGSKTVSAVSPTINQSGTAGYIASAINVTETATGSGSKLFTQYQTNGVAYHQVDHQGQTTTYGASHTVSNLAVPTTSSLGVTGTTGSTAYTYTVCAQNAQGQTIAATPISTAVGNATLSAGNNCNFAIFNVNGASQFNVYRTVGGATQGKVGTVKATGAQVTFADTGLTGDGTSPPTSTVGTGVTLVAWAGQTGPLLVGQTSSGGTAFSLDSAGVITGSHFVGNSSTPAIAAGAAAGTSPTISITGTDAGFRVTLTTGTLPATNDIIATITFAQAFAAAPYVSFCAANSGAATLGLKPTWVTSTTTAAVLNMGTGGLAASTTYIWNFDVTG